MKSHIYNRNKEGGESKFSSVLWQKEKLNPAKSSCLSYIHKDVFLYKQI